MRRVRWFVALSLLLVVAACGSAPQSIKAEGSRALPAMTAEDWVTYGDYLVEMTVTSERRLEPTKDEVERGEGFIGRQVTAQFDQPSWRRPTYNEKVRLPESIAISNGGWVFHGKEEVPWIVEGQVPLEAGKSYLALMAYGDVTIAGGRGSEGATWFALDTLPLSQEDTVERIESGPDPYPMRESSVGMSTEAIAQLLRDTPADPAAKKYMDEDPVQRYQNVARDNDAGKSPTPGPGEKR